MNVMKKSRILIAEDERDLAGILRDTSSPSILL